MKCNLADGEDDDDEAGEDLAEDGEISARNAFGGMTHMDETATCRGSLKLMHFNAAEGAIQE